MTKTIANIGLGYIGLPLAGEFGNARIVDHAMPSRAPIKPQKSTVMGLATLLGILVGIGLTLLRRALHQGVEDPRLIESRLGLPVVVTIPHSDLQEEEFRRMKAYMAGAHLLAQTGAASRVLLVDGDMRRGNLHQYFGLSHRAGGLSEILSGQKPWLQAVRATGVPGLEIITSGTLPPNPSDLLMSHRFSEFIQEISQAYDIVIIDAPPVLAVTDAAIIGRQVGTTLLIGKAKAHTLGEIQAATKRFETAGIMPKGCIFNDVMLMNVGYRYYRYAYHYGYKK